MNRLFRTAALVSLLGFAAHAQAVVPAPEGAPADLELGGFRPVPTDAPLVQDARNFVQARVPSLSQVRVDAAYVQVVNGWNIKLIGTGTEDGRQVSWKFVVHKRREGLMALTLLQAL